MYAFGVVAATATLFAGANLQFVLAQENPVHTASRAARLMAANADTFVNWEGGWQYGGAVTMEGFSRLVQSPEVEADVKAELLGVMDSYLDRYSSSNSSSSAPCVEGFPYGAANLTRDCAYGVLHNASYKWNPQLFGTVGDRFGLFPIANLNRYLMTVGTGNQATSMRGFVSANDDDLEVAIRVAVEYTMEFPSRTPDGTFSRDGSLPNASPELHQHLIKHNSTKGHTFSTQDQADWPAMLWADDQFMGLTLLCRLARLDITSIPSTLASQLGPGQQMVRTSSFFCLIAPTNCTEEGRFQECSHVYLFFDAFLIAGDGDDRCRDAIVVWLLHARPRRWSVHFCPHFMPTQSIKQCSALCGIRYVLGLKRTLLPRL